MSCHTYPNDKLLQLLEERCNLYKQGCHTYPNDKLLQHRQAVDWRRQQSCHTYPNDKLLQHVLKRNLSLILVVVIPIQTISFYNSVLIEGQLPWKSLSYLSKR